MSPLWDLCDTHSLKVRTNRYNSCLNNIVVLWYKFTKAMANGKLYWSNCKIVMHASACYVITTRYNIYNILQGVLYLISHNVFFLTTFIIITWTAISGTRTFLRFEIHIILYVWGHENITDDFLCYSKPQAKFNILYTWLSWYKSATFISIIRILIPPRLIKSGSVGQK